MINLRNAGTRIAVAIIGTGLAASAAFAGLNAGTVNVTLPESVVVGNKILPSGDYVVSQVQVGATTVIVFRNDNGDAEAVVPATRTAVTDFNAPSKKTALTMSASEDGTLRLKDMFIEGDPEGYHIMK